MTRHLVLLDEIRRIQSEITDPVRRTQVLANVFRINTLYMIMQAGSGHIGSSFSAMEIATWLWCEAMTLPNNKTATHSDWYFSSKGHDAPGLYSILLGAGVLPFEKIHTLRRLSGLPGHPDVGTPGMVTNTGALGMGIAKARGMAKANRLQGKTGQFYVLTGDGELQEGQFWESLQPTANAGYGEITVIVDHNKLQSDTWVSSVSDLGDLEAKIRAFGWAVARCDGHNVAEFSQTLAQLSQNTTQPKLLIADTVKGQGVSFMQPNAMAEDALYQFHSGAPSQTHYDQALLELTQAVNAELADLNCHPLLLTHADPLPRVTPHNPERLISAYGEALADLGSAHPNLVVLDADLMVDCGLVPFKQRFPDRFVECGIAEQDMVSMAGGLALKGMIPVVHSFACFLSTRPNEQIFNNATEHTKVIYAGSLAGQLPAGPGHSHQSVRDIATLGATPGLTLIQPACEAETRLALTWAVEENQASTYIRLVTVPCEIPYTLPNGYALTRGQGVVLKPGSDVMFLAYGPVMLSEAWHAAEQLQKEGLSVGVINFPWLNAIDSEWLTEALQGVDSLVVLDDHMVTLGLGTQIAAALAKTQAPIPKIHCWGVLTTPACGQNPEVLSTHALDAQHLTRRILSTHRVQVGLG